MIEVENIPLTPTKARLLHRLNHGQQLLRSPVTLGFTVGTSQRGFNTAHRLAAEALIDHRMVDNHGPIGENASGPTCFLINDRGRAWCQAHPQSEGTN